MKDKRHSMPILVCVLMLVFVIVGSDAVEAKEELTCHDYTLQVTLNPDDTTLYNVVGTLCSVGSPEGKTIQVLVSGATYSRIYWDFTFQPQHYSYVRTVTKQGYATLNLERIGIGVSDHPDGNLVDIQSNAYVVHQVIQALRNNNNADRMSFDKVIVVGHSLGSFMAVDLAANYPDDVDGVILTGFLHNLNPDFSTIALNFFYPATFDERFLGQFPNLDYFTTIPGTRESLFYYSPTTNSQVVALDEETKETATVGEFAFTLPFTTSLQIDVPVLITVGEFDQIFCGGAVDCSNAAGVQTYEDAFFGAAACLQTEVIHSAGHTLNLHTNAHATYAKMIHWADKRVGPDANPPSQPCDA